MTTQLSTKSRSVHPLLGVWKLDETVPVLFEILLHTISTLWAEASVSLTLWSTKCSLDHFKISTQYRSFLRFLNIYIYLVINGQFMPIVQIPRMRDKRTPKDVCGEASKYQPKGASGSTACSKWAPLPYATWCFHYETEICENPMKINWKYHEHHFMANESCKIIFHDLICGH